MRRGPLNGAPQQQQQQTQRSRSRTRSRVRLNRNNFNNQNNNGNNRNGNSQIRANSARRANSIRRTNSVSARLGNNGQSQIRRLNKNVAVPGRRRGLATNTRNPNTQLKKPLAGRIVKRNPRNNARLQRQPGNALGANTRQGKMVKRWIRFS